MTELVYSSWKVVVASLSEAKRFAFVIVISSVMCFALRSLCCSLCQCGSFLIHIFQLFDFSIKIEWQGGCLVLRYLAFVRCFFGSLLMYDFWDLSSLKSVSS